MKGVKTSEDKVRKVVRLFPYYTNDELVKMTGVCRNTISRIQVQYHLRKDRKHLSDVRQRAGNASQVARGGVFLGSNTPESIAKRVETYKRIKKTDIIRTRWGLEPLTRIHLPHGCKEQRRQKRYLCRRGYIVDDPNKVAYYTTNTNRSLRLESIERGVKTPYMHCYFDFKPLNKAAERERGQSGETQASR